MNERKRIFVSQHPYFRSVVVVLRFSPPRFPLDCVKTRAAGSADLARILITEGGAELELRNKKGDTALALASFWGNEDTVE